MKHGVHSDFAVQIARRFYSRHTVTLPLRSTLAAVVDRRHNTTPRTQFSCAVSVKRCTNGPSSTMARGKGKRGAGRGSGRRFAATSAEEIEQRNSRLAELDEKRSQRRAEAEEEEMEKEAEEVGKRVASMTTEEGEGGGGGGGETRKQREERQKAEAAAAYRKRHEAGLTEEYKRDMAKLAEVRKRREVAEARAKAEKEQAESMEEDRKKKRAEQAGALDDNDEDGDKKKSKKKTAETIPKLDKITIKKMKPAQLKEALKLRGQDIQGNAKQLTQRLLDYEKSR